MIRDMRKPGGFPDRSDTNQPVQSQKKARGSKFWILKVKELYLTNYVAKTKALISFAVTAKQICTFVFVKAKIRYSHEQIKCAAFFCCQWYKWYHW